MKSLKRAGALLFLLALGSCTPDPPRNLLLLSLDTLRPDFLGTYGYERPTSPTLDALGYGAEAPPEAGLPDRQPTGLR